jgi:hypothetical protein
MDSDWRSPHACQVDSGASAGGIWGPLQLTVTGAEGAEGAGATEVAIAAEL